MRKLLAPLLVVSLLSSTSAMAQQSQPDRQALTQKQKQDHEELRKQKQAEKQQAAQQRTAQQQAKRQANQKRTAEQKATQQAAQQANRQRVTQQQAAQQAAQQANRQRVARQQAAQRAAQQRATQQRAETRASRQYWSRGDRLPEQYRQDRYVVNNWQYYGLQEPPYGYRWHRDDHNNFYLVVIATGMISAPLLWEDRDRRWNESYHHTYGYDDDIYYRECRTGPDPAGILAGALIGALLGNTLGGHDRTEATIAGIIIGGAAGAALTNHMDCEDRSYAYRAYSSGFNDGRIDYDYGWRNPRTDHHGTFRVTRYYYDRYGFRCAEFRQSLDYLGPNDRDRNGRACLQPDGAWVVVP